MSTILDFFYKYVSERADSPFLLVLRDSGQEPISWASAGEYVNTLASALVVKGVRRGDRVAILSENRYEWVMSDIAIMSAGAISVLISTKILTASDIIVRLRNSGAKMAFVSEKYRKLLTESGMELPVEELICFDDASYSSLFSLKSDSFKHFTPSLDDTSTIIYTSGTTGSPKGVELTYGNYENICRRRVDLGIFPDGYVSLCTLPLDHCLMHHYLFQVIVQGGTMAMMRYRDNPIESMLVLEEDIRTAKPDTMTLVPAVVSGLSRIIKIKGADKSVDEVREFLGGKLKFINAGGARMEDGVIDFFNKIGIPIYFGYGMTETAGGICMNIRPDEKIGSIGPTLEDPSTLMLFSGGKYYNDADVPGEIVYRGGNLMKGYWNNSEATADVIDSEGWFHTGDLASFDSDGYLYFKGRAKSLLVSNSGEKYDPEDIENSLKLACAKIGQVMVYNYESPFTVALVVPAQGYDTIPRDELEAVVKQFYKGGRFSGKFPEIWIPKRFYVLNEPFSAENGMLTPKGSLSRHNIYKRYKDEIESLWKSDSH